MSTLVGVGANKNTNKKEIEKLENQVKELTEKLSFLQAENATLLDSNVVLENQVKELTEKKDKKSKEKE